MSKGAKKWVKTGLRWGIAVFGIWYVISNMSWNDRVLMPGADGWPVARPLVTHANEDSTSFEVRDTDGVTKTFHRDQLLKRVDVATVTLREDGSEVEYHILARKVEPSNELLVAKPRNLWQRYWNLHPSAVRYIRPRDIVGPTHPSLPYPLIDRGIGPMLKQANTGLLLASIFVFPIVFVIVAYRWSLLLGALQIPVRFSQAFVLNMVGSFYNSFMPGSTGGDVLKAYYISRFTPHRTRAVMSVIIDRVIGLLALVFLGGFMATFGWLTIDPADPARRKCGQIAIGSFLIIMGTAVSLLIFYVPALRRATGLAWLIRRLPMQRHVQHAIETMEMLRTRPLLVLWTLMVTLPVHSTVVLSAMLAGMAFIPTDKLHPLYYWVIVPVIVLSGSIPISPQGAGVMEFFAILLTKRQGCTVSQAFALTMSIRIVQILWNLTGGIFVLKGGYHPPTDQEKHTMDEDLPDGSARVTAPS